MFLAAKLEKSKSHSHVSSASTMVSNRGGKGGVAAAAALPKGSTALHRNASTSHVLGAGNRLRTDVKSRYMDISGSKQQSHRAAQPANDSVRHVKQQSDQYSSSGTSTRTASPLANRKAVPAVVTNTKHIDSHMSLDSLASPKKQPMGRSGGPAVLPVHQDDISLSRDSLAESIRSSVRTDGTISQESLHRNRLSVDNRVTAKNLRNNQQKTMNGGSTSGSTSSVGTSAQKGSGSRLTRNFSDSGVVFRNSSTRGLSSNTSSSNASTRTSFLSKKSREILERRSLAESQRASDAEKTAAAQSEPMRRSLPINKSSSTSNIPTTRRILNTTLHLRKTAQMVIPEKSTGDAPRLNGSSLAGGREKVGLKPSRIAQKVPPPQRTQNGGQPRRNLEKSERDLMNTEKAFEVLGLTGSNNCDDSFDGLGFEAKMVRSSTFSKDCPDLSQSIEIS